MTVTLTKTEELIASLNEDLAGEYQAIITYIQYSAVVSGPYRPQLVEFFQAEIPDEQRHAQFLADKIAALGGMPVVTPLNVPVTNDVKQLLQNVWEAEAATIERYRARIDQADAIGDIGLKVKLEDMISDETHHKEEVQKILSNWP